MNPVLKKRLKQAEYHRQYRQRNLKLARLRSKLGMAKLHGHPPHIIRKLEAELANMKPAVCPACELPYAFECPKGLHGMYPRGAHVATPEHRAALARGRDEYFARKRAEKAKRESESSTPISTRRKRQINKKANNSQLYGRG